MEPNHPQQPTDASSAHERQSDADNILADMEARLQGLRELHENQWRKDAELTQREQAAKELDERLRLAQQQSEADRAQLEAQHNDLARQHADLQQHCESLAQENAQTEARAEQESAGFREQIASLQEHVGERDRVLEELEHTKQELARTQSQAETVRDRADRSDDLQSQLDQALNELGQLKAHIQQKLTEAAEQTDQLTRELEAANALSERASQETAKREQLDTNALEHCVRRRNRLGLVRAEMKSREQKVSQAVEKLRERSVECQRILAQRRDVERGRAELRKKRREAERLITRYKGAKYLMFVMVAVVLLAGLSWGVASHFVSATYLASATIQAQNKDRGLEIYELSEWQDYHEALLADQQFYSMAADRFRRRGLEEFGAPAAVGDLVRTRAHHRSSKAGELTIELSGKGQERTELVLNTLVTAFRSYSEAARAQRTDGATTIISSDAAVGTAPLTDTTPIYAAGLFLAGFMLTLGIAAPTWKNLSKSKREFEQQAKADEIGAQADWVEPEKLAKPTGKGKAKT